MLEWDTVRAALFVLGLSSAGLGLVWFLRFVWISLELDRRPWTKRRGVMKWARRRVVRRAPTHTEHAAVVQNWEWSSSIGAERFEDAAVMDGGLRARLTLTLLMVITCVPAGCVLSLWSSIPSVQAAMLVITLGGSMIWLPASWRLRAVVRGLEVDLLLLVDCHIVLKACSQRLNGSANRGSTLQLDIDTGELSAGLQCFARHGHTGCSPERRAEIKDHIGRVAAALDASMGDVLRGEPDAVLGLARRVHTVNERVAEGRWLGLLDSADLPVDLQPDAPRTRRQRMTEAAVVLLLAALAAGAIVGAMALHLPAQYAGVIGLAAFFGGGLAWRGSRVGVTSHSMFGTVGAAFAQQQEPQPPPGGPAPDSTTRQSGGGPLDGRPGS
ncbi:hypothetical protein DSC45_02615 [Streptomyces sp. YIM 130001]|uniref:hypothetical protein n=1 Tax=Streptomyces sp. YIM 130001 TaxID=2259644 RepID=UPI000E65508C|nr:hypothetical protein [Streptomyces sp. YIM 130001]RII20713.1 hypothetical protein DSC45_02615 [Streptomyces sp. YIM 130001]